ncbi:MAG: outer rane lipoprotein omp16 precursor [Segetibacter sp.]|nr:outer rane lipoprotein omp16 precursor [Segetibacter sp.]
MRNILLIIFFGLSVSAPAQSYDVEKVNKKAVAVFERAILKLQEDKHKEAIVLLEKAVEIDPSYVDAILSMAGAYGQLKNYQKSVELYEKGRSIDSQYFKFYNLPYSINLAGLGRFKEALESINQFLTIPELSDRSRKSGEYRKSSFEFAVEYEGKNPVGNYVFAPRNLGDSINSPSSEYYPSITINDSQFVFTRRGEGFREDFFESTILPNKSYSRSRLIRGDINMESSKGAINISHDGEWLIFAGYNFQGGFGDFDLYISYYTPEGWSEPLNLGRNINTEFWESAPTISSDKRALYFSSNRYGGYGGKDIYVSYRLPNGRWGAAQNMGPQVNSAGDEEAPFIHADNATLYYSSNGLLGYGDKDLFLIRKGPNNKWSAPENLGYPINTIEHEGSLFVAADGKTSFYASDRSDSRGGLDIYTFELRPNVRPAKTLYVQGKVYDMKTGKGLPSGVELVDMSTQQPVTNIQTDETGHYFITLPVGKDYAFSVNRKGYLFYTDIYRLSNQSPDSTYDKDIPLKPVELNASVILKNILFETNSAQLQKISLIDINRLLNLLKENPSLKVQINGYTDNVGKPADNLKLSAARSKSVVDYLIAQGVEAARLTFKGFGETKLIAENKTETGRAQNRRTEFVIVGQ